MRAEQIKDAESLQAWLESLPQETEEQRETARRWAVTIAHRAAMRVLPVFVDSILFGLQADGQDEVLKAFRALLISSLAPKTESRAVYRAASGVPFEGDPVAGRFAAKAAAQQACRAISSQLLWEPIRQSIEYSSYVLEEELLGLTLALDAQKLVEANELESFPLWPPTDEVEAFGPEENGDLIVWYDMAKQPLLDFDQDWRFWVEWYENALDGRPQDYDLLTKIALIDPADWEKGADHVNALIQRIVEQHNLAKDARALKEEVARLKERLQSVEHRSHNNPPELVDETVAAQREVTIIWAALDEAEQELEKPDPDPTVLARIGRTLIGAAKAIGAYCASLADIAVKRAVATVAVGLTGFYLAENAETIALFAERLSQFAKSLGAP